MLSAFSMAFVVSFSQYFLTLMIGGGNVKTFAIVMVPYLGSGERNFASIYSVIFLVIMLLVFGILEWIVGRFTKAQMCIRDSTRTDKDQADAFSNWGRVRASTCLLCKGYI